MVELLKFLSALLVVEIFVVLLNGEGNSKTYLFYDQRSKSFSFAMYSQYLA